MKIVIGTAHPELGRDILKALDLPPVEASIKRFADQELFAEIHENVRGEDVYIVQPTSRPTSDNLMELLILADTLKRSSARQITAVIPYFGYARQDRKTGSRTPISAKLAANMIAASGVDRVLTLDLHAGQIQGFFDIPLDHLEAVPLFAAEIHRMWGKAVDGISIVSPDIGGVVRARRLLGKLANDAGPGRKPQDLAIIDKRRPQAGVSEVMNIIGEVEGRHCVMIDDIVDTAGTLCNAAAALLDQGAKSVIACITHAVLSPGAIERIENSRLEALIASDSIRPMAEEAQSTKIRRLSIAGLLADAIREIDSDGSVSMLNLR
jgi:ribose-phosphate pyrophosphokinase